MIVRISTEGQYQLPEGDAGALDELDHKAVASCQGGDEQQFHDAFGELLEFVRSHGTPLGDDELSGSDVILPPPDSTLEDARAEFSAEGLIPE